MPNNAKTKSSNKPNQDLPIVDVKPDTLSHSRDERSNRFESKEIDQRRVSINKFCIFFNIQTLFLGKIFDFEREEES